MNPQLREEIESLIRLHKAATEPLKSDYRKPHFDSKLPVLVSGKSVFFHTTGGYGSDQTAFLGHIGNMTGAATCPNAEKLARARAEFVAASFNIIPQLEKLLQE